MRFCNVSLFEMDSRLGNLAALDIKSCTFENKVISSCLDSNFHIIQTRIGNEPYDIVRYSNIRIRSDGQSCACIEWNRRNVCYILGQIDFEDTGKVLVFADSFDYNLINLLLCISFRDISKGNLSESEQMCKSDIDRSRRIILIVLSLFFILNFYFSRLHKHDISPAMPRCL